MSADLWDRVEDAYDSMTDLRRACRACGSLSRNLEDSYCAKCNGAREEMDLEDAIRTRQACLQAREAQRRRRPEMFDADGNWAPFRRTR